MSGFSQKDGEIRASDETTAAEKRRKRSASEKQRIVEASFKPGASVRAVAEAHGLHPTQVYRWRRQYGRKVQGKSGAALLPVRVTGESDQHSRLTRNTFQEREAIPSVTVHLEFTKARVHIESADRATVLAVLEHLAR